MARWFVFILGDPYESELKEPAELIFALVGVLTGTVVVWHFIGGWMADTLIRSGFTLRAAGPGMLAVLIGGLFGLAFGKVVDRKASEPMRLIMLRCRQVFFLVASLVGVVYSIVYLHSDLIVFFVVCVSMVLLAFSQTRWRPRPRVSGRSARNAT